MIRVLFTSVVPIIIGVIIYIDLKKKIDTYKALAIASCCSFLFPIGPILYIIFRHKLPNKQSGKNFCPKCGTTSNSSICPKCKNTLSL